MMTCLQHREGKLRHPCVVRIPVVARHCQRQNAGTHSTLRGAFVRWVPALNAATASQSKAARAEPVAGLFECGKARLAGRFPELEAELGGMVPAGYVGGSRPGKSPDRADAMVWALWALMLAPRAEPRVRVF